LRDCRSILVLGASGMLGNAVFRQLTGMQGMNVWGSLRSGGALRHFPKEAAGRLVTGVDVENLDQLARLLSQTSPDVIINCVGLVKQLADANDPLAALPINSLLPHRLARLASLTGARVVHISTDCVFSGQRGGYTEDDVPDALDLYGRSKLLGEVDYPNAVTLRTSIIGHELASSHGLVDWFLAQDGSVRGFTKAVFSGLPTVELARVIRDFVLPRPDMRGLFHVSSEPIDKHQLLQLVASQYGKRIRIEPDSRLVIDRSLDSTRFRALTGYEPPDWPELVRRMHNFRDGVLPEVADV
jgi:dTDP-4-dehydrorhamnose reductase